MNTEVDAPETTLDVTQQKAFGLVEVMRQWRPHPTKVKLLIERARSRVCSDAATARTVGVHPNTVAMHKRQDEVFRELWTEVTYDEETAVLLLAYLTTRGAYATIYDAVNGGKPMRANVIAAQSVIELAERRRRAATNPDPMQKALDEALS